MRGCFKPHLREIKNIIWDAAYGICIMVEGLVEGAFEYVAGFKVIGVEELPEGMVVHMLPEQKYAVFEHWGSFDQLHDTYEYIHQIWLPKSGKQIVNGLELEVYTDKFKDFSPDSLFYIYVSIE
jgi:AraC family transcriptional regulator